MSYTFKCVKCGHSLRIADDVTQPWLTCPRCLTELLNPRTGALAPGPAPAASAPPPETAAPPQVLPVHTCPRCGAGVQPGWGLCPACHALLPVRPRRRQEELPDADVRWDSGVAGVGLGVVGILAGLGMVLFYCGGGLQTVEGRSGIEQAAGIGVVIGLVLFGLVIVGMVVGAHGKRAGTRITSIVLGSLAIAFLILGVLVALTVHLFPGCFEPCGRRRAAVDAPPAIARSVQPPVSLASSPGPPHRERYGGLHNL